MANGNSFFKRLNPDEYVDKAISNILDINLKVMEKEDIDLEKLKQIKLLFINELENICIGAGIVSNKKRKFDFDNMNEHEQKLVDAVTDYYKGTTSVRGGALNNMVFSLIREAVEGGYKNKVLNAQNILEQEAKTKGLNRDWVDMQVANYKLQLILKEIKYKQPSSLEIDVV